MFQINKHYKIISPNGNAVTLSITDIEYQSDKAYTNVKFEPVPILVSNKMHVLEHFVEFINNYSTSAYLLYDNQWTYGVRRANGIEASNVAWQSVLKFEKEQTCDCGGIKLGYAKAGPGHSYWCKINGHAKTEDNQWHIFELE